MSGELELHCETAGPDPSPETPVFLLVHGFGASGFSWREWIPGLAERGHVVNVDLKGFGASPRPDDDAYGPGDQADLLVALARRRDLRRIVLVGHSLGGGVALMAAHRLLDDGRLHALVIVAGAAYRQRLPPFTAAARWPRVSGAVARLVGTRRIIRWVLRSIVYAPETVGDDQVEGYAAPLASSEARRAVWAAARRIVPPDLEDWCARYPELDVPALILWGDHDPVVPLWVGRRLAEELPRARLEILEECGHIPAEEQPRRSLERVVAFLEGLDRGDRPGT